MSHSFEERVKADPSHSIRPAQEEVDNSIHEEAAVKTWQRRVGTTWYPRDTAAFLAAPFLIFQLKEELISFYLTTNLMKRDRMNE